MQDATKLRVDADAVVYSSTDSLLASQVSFGRLDGEVSKKESNLVQFSAGCVAQLRAGTPQIMRRQLGNSGLLRMLFDNTSGCPLRDAGIPVFACPILRHGNSVTFDDIITS